MLPVPYEVTFEKYIHQLLDDKYVFVLDDILSGAHTLRIYQLDSFQLLDEIPELARLEFDTNPGRNEARIWIFTNEEADYPYKYRTLKYFRAGKFIDTHTSEKVNAFWYFAG